MSTIGPRCAGCNWVLPEGNRSGLCEACHQPHCRECKKPISKQSKSGKCKSCEKEGKAYKPTQAEIRRRCALIREEWSPLREEMSRVIRPAEEPFTVPTVRVTGI